MTLMFNKHINLIDFFSLSLKTNRHGIQSQGNGIITSNITSGFNKPPVCCTHVLKTAWKPNQ